MGDFDGFQLGAEGFLDMDAFPADGPDLPEADVVHLRTALLADPVDEPTPDEWSILLDQTLAEAPDPFDDPGPFTFDDVDLEAPTARPADLVDTDDASDPDAEVDHGPDGDDDASLDHDHDLDAGDALDAVFDLDGANTLAPGLDGHGDLDGGLDVAVDPGGDDLFAPSDEVDGLADAAPDIDDPL